MLFRRRNTPHWQERLRVFLWPRRNWTRSGRYVAYRLRRLRATPHAIALGCATGVFASFTPFLGGHFILAGMLAWLTRASILASALGTFIGNPLTFPFIWFASFQIGNWALGLDSKAQKIDLSDGVFHKSLDQLWPLLKPMTIGGVPLGILAAGVTYFLVRKGAEAYKKKRLERKLRRRESGAGVAA